MAVDAGHDLGGVFCAPLGEQMGDFVILHAAAPGHFHPAIQPVEAEFVAAVAQGDVHQLAGHALAAHGGVQGRGVHGSQQHVDATTHHGPDVIFADAPEVLGPHLYAVILTQAVAMEPLGVNQLLGRQLRVDHREGEFLFRQQGFILGIQQLYGDGMLTGGGGFTVDPHGLPVEGIGRQPGGGQLLQRVGIQAGGFAQIVRVRVREGGEGHRHAAYPAQMHRRIGFHPERYVIPHGAFRGDPGRLEGGALVFQRGGAKITAPGRLIRKDFFQGRNQTKIDFHGKYLALFMRTGRRMYQNRKIMGGRRAG